MIGAPLAHRILSLPTPHHTYEPHPLPCRWRPPHACRQLATLRAADPPKTPTVPVDLPATIELRQPGVKLTLLAEHPALVTPTGIDVDGHGQIWTVACHTHFRPSEYVGPKHDEVLVFDNSGKNRHVFYEKTTATMNLKLGQDGWVYLAERSRILRVKDADGDGRGDTQENVAVLTTTADYPHNALSGMAWLASGDLLFSLGENYGRDWTLTGRDGRQAHRSRRRGRVPLPARWHKAGADCPRLLEPVRLARPGR